MRKVEVVRPPINYAIVTKKGTHRQVAWFIDAMDAEDFLKNMVGADQYEIAEARR